MQSLRTILIGPPLPTHRVAAERLNKFRALAAFSPDALSSLAYASQEIFLGLVVAGAAGLMLAWPIGLAITLLLIFLALSYFQIIYAYPAGGGSYAVTRQNLGVTASLVTASALLVDYVLTAAVSLTAGVAALASAFPGLWAYRIELALALLAVVTIANLRGLRETGTLMAAPVYLFVVAYLVLLAVGLWRLAVEGPGNLSVAAPLPVAALTPFLILHTFAAGCTALTGIEAISDSVPAFRQPEARNAGLTLIAMAILMGVLFLGNVGLTQVLAVVAGPQETILSALARRVFGSGVLYLVVQIATLLILAVAANTSFSGFPRVASFLAADGHVPRQLAHLGDRLVYANGILLLAGLAALLIVVFGGDSHRLIPLFAVGVFLAFTLSQAGMVVRWARDRTPGWQLKALLNGLGAIVTAVTLVVVAVAKFLDGAWMVLLVIPLLVVWFQAVHKHYQGLGQELSLRGLPPSLKPLPPPRVVLPISGVHRGVIEAVRYARSISDQVTAVYVEVNPGDAEKVRKSWREWENDVPLEVVPSPYRATIGPLLDFLERTDREHNDGQLATVILPEFIPARWWHNLLHNQTATLLRLALLFQRRRYGQSRAIVDVPFRLRH